MRYLSVCSGIEAATVAWHELGWTPVAFSEIEPFPSAVLAHHYPDVPNWGDMTKHKEWPDACDCSSEYAGEQVEQRSGRGESGIHDQRNAWSRHSRSSDDKRGALCEQCGGIQVDILVAGTPCQAFSVAGLREGLADPRGNLTLTFLGVVEQYRPEWVVWENVPGVLSDRTGAFGSLLGGLAELGYGFAYRILDAQNFGVAQRRRRVFVVANARDWRRAAAVLFERESLQRDPETRNKKGKDVAGTFTSRTRSGGWGHDVDLASSGYMQPAVTHALRADGFDASEDGTGRGTPLVSAWWDGSDVAATLTKQNAGGGQRMPDKDNLGAVVVPASIPFADVADPVAANQGRTYTREGSHNFRVSNVAISVRTAQTSANGHGVAEDVAHTLDRASGQAVLPGAAACYDYLGSRGGGVEEGISPTLKKKDGVATNVNVPVAFAQNSRDEVREMPYAGALAAEPGMKQQSFIRQQMAVRRLTPVECERLQGFPDDYTLIPVKKKLAADGPRYKALGNSMAVPVMSWIGQRIRMIDDWVKSK